MHVHCTQFPTTYSADPSGEILSGGSTRAHLDRAPKSCRHTHFHAVRSLTIHGLLPTVALYTGGM